MEKGFIIVCDFLSSACMAQDPFFSQYNSNTLYLNPAFAGSFEKGIFTAAYRNQWPGFDKTYITYHASFNKYYSKIKGGLGIYYLYDAAENSTINTHNVQIMYAPHFQIKNSLVIKPAISFGYFYKTLNWSKLTFGDNIDPRYGFTYPAFTNPPLEHVSFFDVSSGILIYNNFFSAGAAFNHINEPDESFIVEGNSPLPIRYTLHGSIICSFPGKDSIKFQPSVVYSKQGNLDVYKIGATFKISYILLGAFYQGNLSRSQAESIGVMAGYQNKKIKLGYCYDITISKLSETSTLGAHELFISYSFPNRKQKTDGILFNNSFAF
jgi:type IX secretion system PorP/SprF family membrane protein